MNRFASNPNAAHGTRSRYVAGCRCEPCRIANRRYYVGRSEAVRVAAGEVEPNPGAATTTSFYRTRRDGSRYRIEARACPGTGGQPCVAGGVWLRGQGEVCFRCVDKARVWNGLVPAERARQHLRRLSLAGIGRRTVSDACDVADSVLAEILSGEKVTIRAQTERRILDVNEGARADGSVIDSRPSWALIEDLVRRGATKRWVSAELGYAHYLQALPHISAKNAMRIAKLHRRVVAGEVSPTSPFEDARPTYRVLGEILGRGVSRKALSRHLGYHVAPRAPCRVLRKTAERVRAFAAELERRRVEGEPLPESWQASPFAVAFGSRYEGGDAWQWERRTSKRARAREEKELRRLARRRG